MSDKNCCHSNLKGLVMRIEGEEIPYSSCSKCESVWIDTKEVERMDLKYTEDDKNHISDFFCPRCNELFLERTAINWFRDAAIFQCRKCNGVKISSDQIKQLSNKSESNELFPKFINAISQVFSREVSRKKNNKLPDSFTISKTEETDHKCPACNSGLSSYRVYEKDPKNESEFDICDSCYGIWFDQEDMVSRSLKNSRKLELDMDNINPTGRTCPKCRDIKLVSLKYKELDTVIDCCPDCLGTWLDGGELYEFSEYLEESGQGIIDVLIDNALFRDPVTTNILKHFSRTIHEIESKNREQDENLDQAREIQEKLIFSDKEPNSNIPFMFRGYSILSNWIPAKVVGGDYFAVIPFNYKGKELLGLCIADVSGKGLPASLLMANLQALLNSFALHTDSPAKLCTQLNSILHNFTTSNKFITFFYGILEPESGSFKYCNGGHNPPVFLVGDRIHWLKTGGSVLSFFPEWKYKEDEVELKAGDRILFYTDGVSETENPAGEEFGEAKIASLLKKYRNEEMTRTLQFLIRDIKEYNQGNYNDDTTILLLEKKK